VAEKTEKPADIAAVLGVETMPLDELRKKVPELAIARAWAAGDIEFGHRPYCVTGPAGRIGSALVVEDGAMEWTGPKTKLHKPYRDLCQEKPPATEKCKKYQLFPATLPGEEPQLKPVEIPATEAHAAVALYVRLTDKGLGAAQVA
jgi:hypothetical protein